MSQAPNDAPPPTLAPGVDIPDPNSKSAGM